MPHNFYTNDSISISRKNINHMLSEIKTTRFVSFTAGAGYGKSTAVSGFLSMVSASVIWLALTPLDNYYIHLWENVINSARNVSDALVLELEKTGFPQDLASMHQLILSLGQLAKQDQKYVLVLDDYHQITENRIKNFFKDIALADIQNLSIFVLSREHVDFLEEHQENTLFITEKELAFSLQETREYFSLTDISVSDDVLFDIYYNKTHGWPFATYLAAISLKNHPGIADHSFSFSNQLIFDTIDREVFSKFSEEHQIFMLKLSMLDFYPKKLIEDVFDKIVNPGFLTTFSRNTFMLYNQHANAYQFHQLFRDFLHSKSYLLNTQEKQQILSVCADWYRNHDLIIDALNCYRQIRNYDEIWSLISNLFPNFVTMDFANILLEILDEFPQSFIDDHPLIYQILAILWLLSGAPADSVEKCHNYITMLKKRPETSDTLTAIGELYLSLGFSYMYIGDTSFIKYFKLADQYLTTFSYYYGKPWMLFLNSNPITLMNSNKGALENWTSTVEKAGPLFDKLLNENMVGLGPLTRATSYYYQNDLKSAEVFAQKALYQSLSREQIDMICQSYYLLIRIAVGRGDYVTAIKYLNIINGYIANKQIPPLLNIADIATAWFYAEIGLDVCIPSWIADKTVYASDRYIQTQGFERIIKAHCLLNEAHYDELIAYLLSTQNVYCKYHKFICLIYTYIILAIAYYKTNQTESFIRAFHTAYVMSYDNGILMPFIEMRNHSRLLLANIAKIKKASVNDRKLQAMVNAIDDEWLDRVQKKAATWTKMANTVRYRFLVDNPIYDKEQTHLSKTEQEVMQYLSDGLTRDEMADFMNISPNTIKVIIRSVYNKLGARNSAHAVHIAMQRKIIN